MDSKKDAELKELAAWLERTTRRFFSAKSVLNRKTLDLGSKKLTSVPDGIKHLTNLTCLNLSSNQLTSVPDGIKHLTKLTTLFLHNNQLTSVPDGIKHLTKLTTLYLQKNRLTSVPDGIKHLTNLRYLNLHTNHLTSIPEATRKFFATIKSCQFGNQSASSKKAPEGESDNTALLAQLREVKAQLAQAQKLVESKDSELQEQQVAKQKELQDKGLKIQTLERKLTAAAEESKRKHTKMEKKLQDLSARLKIAEENVKAEDTVAESLRREFKSKASDYEKELKSLQAKMKAGSKKSSEEKAKYQEMLDRVREENRRKMAESKKKTDDQLALLRGRLGIAEASLKQKDDAVETQKKNLSDAKKELERLNSELEAEKSKAAKTGGSSDAVTKFLMKQLEDQQKKVNEAEKEARRAMEEAQAAKLELGKLQSAKEALADQSEKMEKVISKFDDMKVTVDNINTVVKKTHTAVEQVSEGVQWMRENLGGRLDDIVSTLEEMRAEASNYYAQIQKNILSVNLLKENIFTPRYVVVLPGRKVEDDKKAGFFKKVKGKASNIIAWTKKKTGVSQYLAIHVLDESSLLLEAAEAAVRKQRKILVAHLFRKKGKLKGEKALVEKRITAIDRAVTKSIREKKARKDPPDAEEKKYAAKYAAYKTLEGKKVRGELIGVLASIYIEIPGKLLQKLAPLLKVVSWLVMLAKVAGAVVGVGSLIPPGIPGVDELMNSSTLTDAAAELQAGYSDGMEAKEKVDAKAEEIEAESQKQDMLTQELTDTYKQLADLLKPDGELELKRMIEKGQIRIILIDGEYRWVSGAHLPLFEQLDIGQTYNVGGTKKVDRKTKAKALLRKGQRGSTSSQRGSVSSPRGSASSLRGSASSLRGSRTTVSSGDIKKKKKRVLGRMFGRKSKS